VERPSTIKVKAYNEKGEQSEFTLEGFAAVVMQHECDHLAGILYVDRIEDMGRCSYEEEADRFLVAVPDPDHDELDEEG